MSARQLAGDAGAKALGTSTKDTPPGTETLGRVFAAAGGPVLLLFDEVLNFMNRHKALADSFHAFLQSLTVAVTGTTRAAAVISLPRSQVEMTPTDIQWQDRITKIVRRVAKYLIVNDEAEIGEVVRRRLFHDLGDEAARTKIAKAFADWCFERRAQLPPEWTAVDTTATDAKAREFLRSRFEACYPLHPATLSVFQRKWQSLGQFQQTRGTLAMLAQWVSWTYREHHTSALREPLLTLGSAPLEAPEFRAVVLGQIGEARLATAIEADIAGQHAHARVLDADTKGHLRGIHRRTGTAILFESSGGQTDKTADMPELRFALGEPGIDTTSIDNAALALEAKGYYIRRVGADGFRLHHQVTLRKVVSDRRAGFDDEREVTPAVRKLVEEAFARGATVPVVYFPEDSAAVQDSPRLTLIVMDPAREWTGDGSVAGSIREWTRQRGTSPRLYPASLIWCVKKPGRDFRDRVEQWLAWRRVQAEVREGTLGTEYDKADLNEVQVKVKDSEAAATDEVWGGYRFVALADNRADGGLKVIDLGAGHSSASETLCGRVLQALKGEALLNETVGAGYLDRNWPEAFKGSGAWPLSSLRQAFLNGSLTRLRDPDAALRRGIPEFVQKGDFGLASSTDGGATYACTWFAEPVAPEEVEFVTSVFLLTKSKAQALKAGTLTSPIAQPAPPLSLELTHEQGSGPERVPGATHATVRVVGSMPPELWNRFGTKIIPKLRSGDELNVGLDLSVRVDAAAARNLEAELRQLLNDLGLDGRVRVERS